MQIDWGWGASLSAHTSPMWGRGRLNSDTLPMSHSVFFIHTHKHTHAYGQRDGGGTVTTTCLALCRLSTPVTPARVDPSLSLFHAFLFTLRVLRWFLLQYAVWNICFFLFSRRPCCKMDFGFELIFPSVGCFQEVGMLILALWSG